MSAIGEGMMLALASLGLRIEKTQENIEDLVVYISVPERSYHKNEKGEEMSGMSLAKRFKTTMTKIGIKRLTVKSRIRIGENWTKEMAEAAELEMRKTIYGSQY